MFFREQRKQEVQISVKGSEERREKHALDFLE
jgi:hypothetical protein